MASGPRKLQIIDISFKLLTVLSMPADRLLKVAMLPEHSLVRVKVVELLKLLLLRNEAFQNRVLPHESIPKGGESFM